MFTTNGKPHSNQKKKKTKLAAKLQFYTNFTFFPSVNMGKFIG
jgi:hypothetical protein